MGQTASLNARIIETLYAEGLALSDEVRTTFDLSRQPTGDPENAQRIALSCEALRTTTRMMHAVAWLLNHRAYFRGEISEFQLRRQGRLATGLSTSEPERMALLDRPVRELILSTERFYARLLRIDAGWRQPEAGAAVPAVRRLHERLTGAVR